jgi:hypothetical protein
LPFKPFYFVGAFFVILPFCLQFFYLSGEKFHIQSENQYQIITSFIVIANPKSSVHTDIVKGRGDGWISIVSCAVSLKCDPVPIFQQEPLSPENDLLLL